MKILLTLFLFAASFQGLRAWAHYYDGQSALFVLVDDMRIEDLRDSTAVFDVAIRPPATWMGVIGQQHVEVTGFPIHLLDKIRAINEPAFFVFYSDRTTLTDENGEFPNSVRIGGAINYSVGILTATELFSLSGDKIKLKPDVTKWIEAYRNVLNQDDPKDRNFYLKIWACDKFRKVENERSE